MPISDLLAQISGQPSSPAPKQSLPRLNTFPKRKADDQIRNDAPKTPRTLVPPSRPAQASRPLDRQTSAASKPLGSASKPSVLSSKPMNSANRVTKPQTTPRPTSTTASNGTPTTPASKAAPKKGSYAEIMARASKAQAVMGQVGRIQHKKVEGGAIKKEKEPKVEQRPNPGKRGPGYSGTSAAKVNGPVRNGPSSARDSPSSTDRPRSERADPPARPKGLTAKQQAELDREKERRMKKLSQTSSYSGTSRSKPASSTKRPNPNVPRGGALLSAPKVRPAKNSRYAEDDYDEELDDFIDYDDEEDDQGGPRYDYASDASSDMEAGLDDIDTEERRAERMARQEDIEEQRLEQNLKMAKEERKRKALEELRARRR